MKEGLGDSLIKEFYDGEHILLTGGTGFLGKIALDKLLRVCNPSQIFLLVRGKKGKTPEERIQELFAEPVFQRLKKEVPGFLKSIYGIEGDVSLPRLGLNEQSWSLLREKTTIVIHGAATVRFDEDLKTAVNINVRGTREIINLCKEMPHLKAVTHISTAYAHCNFKEVNETFYDPPVNGDFIISMIDSLNDDQISAITPSILGEWPNTYSFTKAIAEDLIRTHARALPIAVFRPAIVIGAKEEPVKGWIDNLYGPTGVLAGAGAGVMRVLWADADCVADLVPVDMAVNAVLTVTYETTLRSPGSPIKIYNFVSSNQNPLTWGEFHTYCMESGKLCPSVKSIYYYTFTLTANRALFTFYTLLFHLLPAICIDVIMILLGKKFRLMKVYNKLHKFSNVIGYFALQAWKFENKNTLQLLSNMGPKDRELFDFDLAKLNWRNFFDNNVQGIRVYIFKDPLTTIEEGKKRFFWLHILHRVVQVVFSLSVFWMLKSLYYLVSSVVKFDSGLLTQ